MERDWTTDWENPDNPYNQGQNPWTPPPANPPRADDDPYYTQPLQPGILAPETGYGWGGVENPAYPPAAPVQEAPSIDNRPPMRDPTPTSGGPPPTSSGGGGVPSINVGGEMPTSGINVPSSTLPTDILDLFNKPPAMTPIQTAYQDALLKYMGRAQETPTLDDSILGPQTEVFRAANQRNTERQRRSAVERASAQGQNQSGYLDNLINEGVQKQGFNNAQFNANLLGGEMSKRREELQAALQLASATGNAEATRELQARLAQVSAAMQQQGLNLQGQLGSGDLALRKMQTQMGNDQFYDQLGVNSALNLEGLNQRALQTILGGLG